jgi:shikimate dehydrogenase
MYSKPGSPPPDRYALMGHPVSHSWSPFIHGMFARQTGQNMQYRLVDVPPDRFRSAAIQFFIDGGSGLNVTVPHKQAAAELVNDLTPRAARAHAVNTIRVKPGSNELVGDNTDGIGLVIDLVENLAVTLEGARVLLLGAGGATRGVLAPLLERKPERLVIANRTVSRATELAAEFGALGRVEGTGFDTIEAAAFDLVINATSAGLQGELPPLPPAIVGAHTVCYDMSYSKGDTPFTHWAQERGAAAAHKGWGMLVEQAAEAFLVWRGVRPTTRHVLELLQAGNVERAPAK